QPPQKAIIYGQIKIGRNRLQAFGVFGAGVKLRGYFTGAAGSYQGGAAGETQHIFIPLAELPQIVIVLSRRIGNPGADKVMLHHGYPTTFYASFETVVFRSRTVFVFVG